MPFLYKVKAALYVRFGSGRYRQQMLMQPGLLDAGSECLHLFSVAIKIGGGARAQASRELGLGSGLGFIVKIP